MSTLISVEHTTVRLNGHTFTGFSSDADAIQFPDIEGLTSDVGPTGRLMILSTGDIGGDVTLKFQANSPSVAYLMRKMEEQVTEFKYTRWKGKVWNSNAQFGYDLYNGWLRVRPGGHTMGKGAVANHMFTFVFEAIVPDFKKAKFE